MCSSILLSVIIYSTLLSPLILSFLNTFIAYIYPVALCLTYITFENPPLPITFSIKKLFSSAKYSPYELLFPN